MKTISAQRRQLLRPPPIPMGTLQAAWLDQAAKSADLASQMVEATAAASQTPSHPHQGRVVTSLLCL
jgi:hypothetical protein